MTRIIDFILIALAAVIITIGGRDFFRWWCPPYTPSPKCTIDVSRHGWGTTVWQVRHLYRGDWVIRPSGLGDWIKIVSNEGKLDTIPIIINWEALAK